MPGRWMLDACAIFLVPLFTVSCDRPMPETANSAATVYPTEKLEEIQSLCEEAGTAALLILHEGEVLISWGEVDREYWTHSIRKSLLNSIFGLAVERGEIDLDETLADLGIDDIEPSLSQAERRAAVRDLLRSRSGVYHLASGEAESMTSLRPKRGTYEHGEHFYYNNWDFNVLGVIYEMKTGRKIFEAFEKEIAVAIGMKHFSAEDGIYHFEREKSEHPAYHIRMSASDLALFGQLYLRNGRWQEKRILPESWIAECTQPYSLLSEEWGIHYGQLWYVVPADERAKGPWFFHTGAGVHMLAVFPGLDLVMVHRVDTNDETYEFDPRYLHRLIDMILDARTGELPG